MHSTRIEHDAPRENLPTRVLRCTAIVGMAVTISAVGGMLTARPVHAAATGCNRNVFMHLSTPKNGKVSIEAWADDSCFTGHFDLTGPNGLLKHGPNQQYCPGDRPHPVQWFENISAVVGKYCVTGYSTGKVQGKPCESVE